MNVFVAGVTAERQYGASLKSFFEIKKREGDQMVWQHGTRGDVARTIIGEKFLINPKFDALLMCDLDQKFPTDTLEILRSHDLDMVSGHYMKRSTKGLTSIWQYSVFRGDWPYMPFIDPPRNGLHKIATTGMGCVLIKREVIEAVAAILPPGASPFEIGKLPDAAIPQANFGSDYRFFYLAQKLGYELWGDTAVDTPHASTMWLTRDTIYMLQKQRKDAIDSLKDSVFRNAIRAKGMITANAVLARIQMLQDALNGVKSPEEENFINGQLAECSMWLEELKANAPNQVVTDAWRRLYNPIYTTPNVRKIGNLNEGVSLPVFRQGDLQHEIENRDKAITGESEQETVMLRTAAKQNQAAAAVRSMHAKNADGRVASLITSTEPGEMEIV